MNLEKALEDHINKKLRDIDLILNVSGDISKIRYAQGCKQTLKEVQAIIDKESNSL